MVSDTHVFLKTLMLLKGRFHGTNRERTPDSSNHPFEQLLAASKVKSQEARSFSSAQRWPYRQSVDITEGSRRQTPFSIGGRIPSHRRSPPQRDFSEGAALKRSSQNDRNMMKHASKSGAEQLNSHFLHDINGVAIPIRNGQQTGRPAFRCSMVRPCRP